MVCSNDSRNALYDENFEVSNRLFGKVFTEFNIDSNRIYTTGFSCGARLASTIAVFTKKIQGVVACGAGFSNYGGHLPGHESFSCAAVIGNEDMNFIEIKKTEGWLDRLWGYLMKYSFIKWVMISLPKAIFFMYFIDLN
ncbi:hypothetical protein FVB32_16015 [Flagellimonas hymeniacidonis]|uniref:Uncharacterized protein n=1 Tax=Flagellimonas hymeniacidonis TaxID=2603628 RepID=A0A5C8V3D8_9FLAO|nr:hypothetical protein [Flagellimonas hymeniacidonis]TXN36064.1 hypothetical protein FVB32_16015 [Flagellimonas hymeniacidonis]